MAANPPDAAALPSQTPRKPGRPSKYANVEEKKAAERARKQQARDKEKAARAGRVTATATVTISGSGDENRDDDEEAAISRYANDYGRIRPPDPDAISAFQVCVNHLKQPGNYAAWRRSSPAVKKKMVRTLQEEMSERGMQSASRDPKAVMAQIRKIVKSCTEANAFETSTGEGLTEVDRIWLDKKRMDGVVEHDESDLNAFIRLKWPMWDDMRDVMRKRVALNPPDVFDSGLEIDDIDLDDFARRAGVEEGDNDWELEVDADHGGARNEAVPRSGPSHQSVHQRQFGSLFDLLSDEERDDSMEDADDDDQPLMSGSLSLSAGQRQAAAELSPSDTSTPRNAERGTPSSSTSRTARSDGPTRPRHGHGTPKSKKGTGNSGSAMDAIAENQRMKAKQTAEILKRQDERDKEWLKMEKEKAEKEDIRLAQEALRQSAEATERKRKRAIEEEMLQEESYLRCLRTYTEYKKDYPRDVAGRMAFRDKWEKAKEYIPE